MADPKSPQLPLAAFANVARVRHTAAEFYIDFGQLAMDQAGVASLISRLVMTPQHTKLLLKALTENIAKYENRYGEIEVPPPPKDEVIQ